MSRRGLGDFRSDLVSTLATFVGQAKAESTVTGMENLIVTKAKAGALQAIPQVKVEVTRTVLPMFIGSAVVGAVGAALGITALVKLNKMRKT